MWRWGRQTPTGRLDDILPMYTGTSSMEDASALGPLHSLIKDSLQLLLLLISFPGRSVIRSWLPTYLCLEGRNVLSTLRGIFQTGDSSCYR